MFLTITANVLAFFLGTIYFDRYNLAAGVAVFVVTALIGTILGSMIEAYLRSLLAARMLARARRPRPALGEAPKPLPSSAGSP
ncbi:MAG TPA: hypothetical protein VI298_01475 [Geobacteraceae bacterium]